MEPTVIKTVSQGVENTCRNTSSVIIVEVLKQYPNF